MNSKKFFFVIIILSFFVSDIKGNPELEGIEREFPHLKKPKDMENNRWRTILYGAKKGKEQNVPIQFYGKIIDQYNNSIPGVEVFAQILGYNKQFLEDWLKTQEDRTISHEDLSDQKTTCMLIQSDPNGLFCVENIEGYSLTLNFFKEGYITSAREAYSYKYKKGEDNKFQQKETPEVFSIWQLSSSLPDLITNRFSVTLPDPNTYYINLLKQKFVTAKDNYDFSCTYQIQEVKNGKYSWEFQIDTPENGGVTETNEIFMFKAPEKFSQKWSISVDKNSDNWSRRISRCFYIKSRDEKQYANVTLEAFVYADKKVNMNIESTVNSSGSRNLERVPGGDLDGYNRYLQGKRKEWEKKLKEKRYLTP